MRKRYSSTVFGEAELGFLFCETDFFIVTLQTAPRRSGTARQSIHKIVARGGKKAQDQTSNAQRWQSGVIASSTCLIFGMMSLAAPADKTAKVVKHGACQKFIVSGYTCLNSPNVLRSFDFHPQVGMPLAEQHLKGDKQQPRQHDLPLPALLRPVDIGASSGERRRRRTTKLFLQSVVLNFLKQGREIACSRQSSACAFVRGASTMREN